MNGFYKELILTALKEDISSEDLSTNAVVNKDAYGKVDLISKQDGIICGLDVFEETFKLLDQDVTFDCTYQDGDFIAKGTVIGVVKGNLRALLTGERVALNYLQRMSGIASYTKDLADVLQDSHIKLLDTRKTTPNNRIFEKYATRVGGASNHRYNLSDGIMLKDNHIAAAGSITKAVKATREYMRIVQKIEVECETLEMVQECLDCGVEIIMLDNMDNEMVKKACDLIDKKALIEISGNVTKPRLEQIKDYPVDFISSGSLTYGAHTLDLSLKNMEIT